VTQEANDKKQLEPMVEKIKVQSGQKPEQLLADSGYCSEPNLEYLSDQGIDTYIATEKVKHGAKADKAKPGPLPRGATLVDRMKRKLQTKGGLGHLCGAEGDRGAGIRIHQARAWIQAIPAAGPPESQSGVGIGVFDAQHFEDVPDLLQVGSGENKWFQSAADQ
jgi:Transposase DDE domain